jgi:hypothetical protein
MYLSREKIVGVMSRSDFYSSRAKRHVDQHRVADDGDAAAKERVNQKFTVEVSVAGILGMNSHGSISKHGFETSGGNHNFIVAAFDFVSKFDEDPELVGAVAVAGNALAFRLFELLRVDFNVRNGALEGACANKFENS